MGLIALLTCLYLVILMPVVVGFVWIWVELTGTLDRIHEMLAGYRHT